jgi:hypothetical protein
MYFFVNKSKMDLGIVIQQSGGQYGSRAVGRFDIGNCMCLIGGEDLDEGDNTPARPVLACR